MARAAARCAQRLAHSGARWWAKSCVKTLTALAGTALGTLGGIAIGHTLAGAVFGVDANRPLTFVAVASSRLVAPPRVPGAGKPRQSIRWSRCGRTSVATPQRDPPAVIRGRTATRTRISDDAPSRSTRNTNSCTPPNPGAGAHVK